MKRNPTKSIPSKTLRELCVERGINPDAPGYKAPGQKFLALDRIIPGVPDRMAPSEQLRQIGRGERAQNARSMYTRTQAAKDAQHIAMSDHSVTAYVLAFCRLNKLVAS